MKWITLVLVCTVASAATPPKKGVVTEELAKPAGKAIEPGILWDSWYTITAAGSVPYGYYNDKVEVKEGRVIFQNKLWKKEEGYINQESLGGFAENTPELKPLFFNFHSIYRSTEISIDGNVKDGKQLVVKARKGAEELPPITKMISGKVILSVFFPVWVGRKLSTMKVGQTVGFDTILEDNLDLEYRSVPGRVRLEKPDPIAQKTRTQKLAVDYNDRKSLWWVEPNGNPVRIEMPAQKLVIERVAREKAQEFLSE